MFFIQVLKNKLKYTKLIFLEKLIYKNKEKKTNIFYMCSVYKIKCI